AGRRIRRRRRLRWPVDERSDRPGPEACARNPRCHAGGHDAAPPGRTRRRGGRGTAVGAASRMSWRDVMCGELRAHDAGRSVTVAGWADTRRDHGGLVFVDLRDHTGKLQLVVDPEALPQVKELRNEFVVQAAGELVAREAGRVNPNLPTGEVELQVEELRILSRSTPLPFQLDEENVDETLRLRYR